MARNVLNVAKMDFIVPMPRGLGATRKFVTLKCAFVLEMRIADTPSGSILGATFMVKVFGKRKIHVHTNGTFHF
jgi:hypothetical protein